MKMFLAFSNSHCYIEQLELIMWFKITTTWQRILFVKNDLGHGSHKLKTDKLLSETNFVGLF